MERIQVLAVISCLLAAAIPDSIRAGDEPQAASGESRLAKLKFGGTAHVIVPKQPPVFHVLERGDPQQPQEQVAPAGLKALEVAAGLGWDFGLKPDAPGAERRLALARWLTDRRNPLTPRVMVNRLWHYHFGQGLVDTPSDFGFSGGRPTHPELLDWLAAEFVGVEGRGSRVESQKSEDGGQKSGVGRLDATVGAAASGPQPSTLNPQAAWSLKHLHRLIVTSAAYRQRSNVENAAAVAVDAENRLLWRANRRRLEGEAVRDAVLAVSGALNPAVGGPSYRDVKVDGGVMGSNAEFTVPTAEFNAETLRRTIYRLWARAGNNPLLESLDCPDPSVMLPRRTMTTTPVQSLSLLNNAFMEHCAGRFAERVRREGGSGADAQIRRAYALAFGREPRPRELKLSRPFVEKRGLEQLCLVLMNANEFLFVD
ncbi:MAG: DUF1553 domain-containing protein [Planctomycetes bacterium]|nr:DUF1553 domain-containing protein [Planctomycetota bacterium]